MSIFGSLFTAVSGLNAQSQSIAMISNNIANVNTVGYKRTDAAFSSLVTSETRSTLYSPGSVRASQNARIDQQGILQQSASATDIALSGNGFFIVRANPDDIGSEPLYTRAGSFSEDKDGVLQNTSGFFLMGWPLDQDGAILGSQSDIGSLVPINVAFLNGSTQATSTAKLSINLDAAEDQAVYPLALPVSTPNFSRDIRVFDSEGGAQDLTVNFLKHQSPTATATGVGLVDLNALQGAPLVGNVPGLAAGDTFTIDVPSAALENSALTTIAGSTVTLTIGATTTVAELLNAVNLITDVDGFPVVSASVDGAGHLSFRARNPGENLTLAETVGTPLTDLDLGASLGVNAAPALPDLLTANDPAIALNPDGWWYVEFRDQVGNVIEGGSINFNGSGQLNALEDINGDVNVALNNIDWPNSGADLQDINFNINSFTQFSGDYNVVSTTQNGAALGLRTGVTIDREGFVTAQFSNGLSTRIYKLAIATFSNTNGLDQLTGNVYRQSDTSGDFNLREAGSGSAGLIESGALESANVDLADEFSKMIVTQRAYSANTKVISTADEMTAELLRLR